MAKKSKETKAKIPTDPGEITEGQESAPVETIIVSDEQFEKIEELIENPPKIGEDLKKALKEYKEAQAEDIKAAAESDKIPEPSLPKDNGSLKIGETTLKGDEEADLRAVSELHYRSKGLRFRGVSLSQAQLNALLKDPTFVGKLGKLRKYV